MSKLHQISVAHKRNNNKKLKFFDCIVIITGDYSKTKKPTFCKFLVE